MEFEVNMPLIVFKEGNLIAFRGSDGHCFNVIELTGDVDFKKMIPRSKVKLSILTLYSKDGVVIFQQEEQWRGGSMQSVHILGTEKDKSYRLMQPGLP